MRSKNNHMNKALWMVLLIIALMSTEVTMPIDEGNRETISTGAMRAPARTQARSTPRGKGGRFGQGEQQPSPYNYATSPIFQNNPATPNIPAQNQTRLPAWLQNMRDNAQGGGAFNYANRPMFQNNQATPNAPAPTPQTRYGGTNPNPEVTQGHLRGTNQPFVVGQDSITQSPTSPYDSYNGVRFPQINTAPMNRSLFGPGIATIDDLAYWNQQPQAGGFGSSYGGNWRRGGGGGGGGGGYGYGDSYPAWLKQLMGLYSWNIK